MATTPAVPEQRPKTSTSRPPPFDFSQRPVIEGFQYETVKGPGKFKENPLVPIGCLGTAGALIYGLRAFKQGKTRQSQLMMRGRIFAQGFTIVAMIFGVFATALKPKE